MKILFLLIFQLASSSVFAASDASCVFDHKTYDPPFSIQYRKGAFIKGRFGCEYICTCGGRSMRVMHILEESHFDIDPKDGTGGISRAKWFICPYSVRPESFKKKYSPDGLTQLPYEPEINYDPTPVEKFDSPQIKDWAAHSCH